MKAVVKNKIRYKVIKYPKGVGLHDDRTVPREGGTVGVSTFRFGDNWFVTSKGRALFKAYNVEKQGIRIVNELLYDELANQIDLPVAKYLPANYKNDDKEKNNTNPNLNKQYHGLASIDVTKKNEKIMTGYQLLKYNNYRGRRNTFYDYIDALDYYKKHEKCNVDKNGIVITLLKMMLLDTLTFNEDRHMRNISFIKNEKDNYLMASPVIDNELCFFGKNLWLFWSKKLKNIDCKTFFKEYGRRMCFFVDRDTYYASNESVYEANIEALVKLANKHKGFKKYLNEVVESINIDEAFENVEKKGYKVTEDYTNFVKNLMNISTSTFKKHIKEFNDKKQAKNQLMQ